MSRTRLYWPMRALLRAMFRVGRWHVEGLEHVPQEGPLIIASNHINLLDAPLVMASLPIGPITVLAKAEFQRWYSPAGWLLRTVDVIFVRREQLDRQALRAAIRVLEEGGRIGLAPEGTRSRTGALQRGREGVAYLALRTGAPVLPAAVWGHERFLKDLRRGQRPEYWVRFGPLVRLAPDSNKPRSAQLAEGTERIMRALAALLPPAYRGVYAEATPA